MVFKVERILPFAKQLLKSIIEPGETVIDATAGNGYDTLFLAECVGQSGHVLSFDIQEDAIKSTQNKLTEANIKHVLLIQDGHENVLQYIDTTISAAIFNLGYLPGSNQSVTTQGQTTWQAVTSILTRLKKKGLIVLVIYHGHEEGKIERDYLQQCLTELNPKTTQVLQYRFLNRPTSPFIIAIEKTK